MQRIFVIDSESSGAIKGQVDESQKRMMHPLDYRELSPFPKAMNNTTRTFFNQDLTKLQEHSAEIKKNTTKGVQPFLATAHRDHQLAYKYAMKKQSLNFAQNFTAMSVNHGNNSQGARRAGNRQIKIHNYEQ